LVASVPARKEPKIGPVQLNDTSAKVIAMKNTPKIPPILEALSALLANDDGNWISKYPKNEMAKTTKTTKNTMFKIELVAISFKVSGGTLKTIKGTANSV